jgi:hypothetical protein
VPGVVQRGEADLVNDDEVVAQQGVDDASDGVVGHASVELLDELGGGEVADLVSGRDGGVAERDEQVGLARAGRPDQTKILLLGYPFEAAQVVKRGLGHRGHGDLELVQGLDDREPGPAQSVALVGLVAGGDLGLDEGA